MNEQTHESSHENNGSAAELSGHLADAVGGINAASPPTDSLDRAIARIRLLQTPITAGEIASHRGQSVAPTIATREPAKRSPLAWRVKAVLGLAAGFAAIAISIYFLTQPRVSLAAIANALAQQSWIHAVSVDPNGKREEAWVSPDRRFSATKNDEWIEFYDQTRQINYSYDIKEKTLYRVSQDWKIWHGEWMFDSMRVLWGEATAKPLEDLQSIFGEGGRHVTLLSQKRRTVRENGRTWEELTLKVRHNRDDATAQMLLRVDPQTKLPDVWRCESKEKGQWLVQECRFDYSTPGPLEIYDLGVPRSATVVDRIPTGDVTRLTEGIVAQRYHMDDYTAIQVHRNDEFDYQWWADVPYCVFHKGNRYAVAWALGGVAEDAEEPAKNAKLEEWWQQRVKKMYYLPYEIIIGDKEYRCDYEPFKDAAGRPHIRVTKVTERKLDRVDDWFPASYTRLPEFAARGPLASADKTWRRRQM